MTKKTKEKDDPAMARIREARHEIAATFAQDPKELVAYYLKRQQERETTNPKEQV